MFPVQLIGLKCHIILSFVLIVLLIKVASVLRNWIIFGIYFNFFTFFQELLMSRMQLKHLRWFISDSLSRWPTLRKRSFLITWVKMKYVWGTRRNAVCFGSPRRLKEILGWYWRSEGRLRVIKGNGCINLVVFLKNNSFLSHIGRMCYLICFIVIIVIFWTSSLEIGVILIRTIRIDLDSLGGRIRWMRRRSIRELRLIMDIFMYS